ncbi:MAG: shikimate kinase [Ancrocorticia sp.]|nr:shikimate kinase [Ancrocorticia sp.]MCI1932645.1 shikimate kinase [Ancrocorticia sp.]MCI1964294.1 shikimate kinase [Ancrocorticia sp.]MCI2002897.1 shikimate kinase [Ancrocorticia sp.]MCI2013279.1 shikimate kinase [Ancrocorticia sp.]
MSVVAVMMGMPGSGKTTVGTLVAQSLALPFADSDKLIEEHTQRTIPDIFASDGERGFRALEARVIADALEHFDGVLSLGGGAITHSGTRELLRQHPVFMIEVPYAELVRRIRKSSTVRPLLAEHPEEAIARLLEQRAPLYREAARYVVSSTQAPVQNVARQVLDLLGFRDVPVINMKAEK